MIFYIAGKMAGLPDLGKSKFSEAAKMLRDRGYIVLNPAELPDGMPGDRYMPICLAMVNAANAVYALDNWKDSNGAVIEIAYSRCQKKYVIYETDVI